MASPAVGITAAAYSWNPFLAFGAVAVASYLDQRFLYPAILGDGEEKAKPRPLVGLPQTSNTPGTPRVWAMGRRVRVPMHIMYQSEKTREDTITGPKGGVAGQIKRVFADVGLSVNDRQTLKMNQLVANGQLVWWSDKNLVKITTSEMTSSTIETVTTSGTVAAGSTTTVVNSTTGSMTVDAYARNYNWLKITSGPLSGQMRPIISNTASAFTVDWAFGGTPGATVTYQVVKKVLKLTMNSTYEPDFTDQLVIGDIVDLRGFSDNAAGSIQGRGPWTQRSWWRVNDVTRHTSTPSSVTLEALIGQDMGSLTSVTAGTALNPASIVREDYFFLISANEVWGPGGTGQPGINQVITTNQTLEWQDMIKKRWARFMGVDQIMEIKAYNAQKNIAGVFTNVADGSIWQALFSSSPGVGPDFVLVPGPYINTNPTGSNQQLRIRCANNTLVLTPSVIQSYEGRMFAADPVDSYYQGTDGQLEDSIIARTKTAGQIPGFRGMAYQMLDQWDLSTYFGNQVPPIIEGIIEPDSVMIVPQAVVELCERAELQDLLIDVADVDQEPFEGYWTQGAIPTVTALQPVMLAYGLLAQERNNTLAFFNVENADSIQIENGASFSDLGVASGADTPNAGDKLKITQRDTQDLPTSIGVSHQDPDQQYAQGFQHFRQRQPSPLASNNEQNIQLDNVVLSRKKARNLAATLLRRSWVNATSLDFQLPVAYLEALENDLVTLTDDEGQDYTARIIRREVGNNFVVNVTAVVEDVTLGVRGSPVQPSPDIVISTPTPVTPTFRVLDIPPLVDEDAFVPGYYVGACSAGGARWGGAVVYESRDGGTNYTQVATLNTQCGMGTLTSSLASGTPGDGIGSVTYDTTNSFTVAIDRDNVIPLVTVTTADVEAGWNWMLIEDGANFEILGARDVVDNGDGTFTFDYLLRGLRGTYDSAATTKAAGSKVTFLYQARQQGAVQFVPTNLSAGSLPTTIDIKVVAAGQSIDDVTAETVALDCWNARPMPGRMFTTEYDLTTSDRIFGFDHWTRLQAVPGSGTPYPMDESFEGYKVNFYDPTGTTLLRTKTISAQNTGSTMIRGAREFTYTAAEQTADGYTPGPTETFKVERFQLGDFGNGRTWIEDV
jgi:Putative phage tail protein